MNSVPRLKLFVVILLANGSVEATPPDPPDPAAISASLGGPLHNFDELWEQSLGTLASRAARRIPSLHAAERRARQLAPGAPIAPVSQVRAALRRSDHHVEILTEAYVRLRQLALDGRLPQDPVRLEQMVVSRTRDVARAVYRREEGYFLALPPGFEAAPANDNAQADDADELLDAKRLREALRAAIRRLPPQHAQTIAVYLDDPDEPHLALGVSPATWRQRLRRAIIALAELLAKRAA